MLKSLVLTLSKQNTCNGVISFKTRLMLAARPFELLQCSWDSSGRQNTSKAESLKYEMRRRKTMSLYIEQQQVMAQG